MELPDLTLDEDGYPTEAALEAIEKWPHTAGFDELLRRVRAIWRYGTLGYWREEADGIHASTAGWSGNESIVGALERNRVFWILYWESSRRGGHHVFKLIN